MFNPLSQYSFRAKSGRFHNNGTGRFVSQEEVNRIIDETIEQSLSDISSLITNSSDLNELQDLILLELRNLHVQMTMLGAGGRNNVTQSQWGKLGTTLRSEYRYMRNFLQEINDNVLPDGEIRRRMNMYGNKIWFSYWTTRTQQMQDAGFTEERRVLTPVENCKDCKDLAAKGFQPIGTLPDPADGSTRCLSSDRCYKEYR